MTISRGVTDSHLCPGHVFTSAFPCAHTRRKAWELSPRPKYCGFPISIYCGGKEHEALKSKIMFYIFFLLLYHHKTMTNKKQKGKLIFSYLNMKYKKIFF